MLLALNAFGGSQGIFSAQGHIIYASKRKMIRASQRTNQYSSLRDRMKASERKKQYASLRKNIKTN